MIWKRSSKHELTVCRKISRSDYRRSIATHVFMHFAQSPTANCPRATRHRNQGSTAEIYEWGCDRRPGDQSFWWKSQLGVPLLSEQMKRSSSGATHGNARLEIDMTTIPYRQFAPAPVGAAAQNILSARNVVGPRELRLALEGPRLQFATRDRTRFGSGSNVLPIKSHYTHKCHQTSAVSQD